MRGLYPLKFNPIHREMIWGGGSLRNLFNKPFPAESKIGESWEISAVKEKISVVSNGFLAGNNLQELIEVFMGDLVGDKIYESFGNEFPLLVKLIDAQDDLSIQVHPGDELAALRHNGHGKTEMWYVLEAEPGAKLISGFNREVNRKLFMEKLGNGKLLDILNVVKVKPGDVFFMPAGRVHAICKGIVLAEIQQTSDITYRLYDWDRVDASGNPRQLHLDLAMDAIDFNSYGDYRTIVEEKQNSPVLLAECQYFTTHLIGFEGKMVRDYSLLDSFVIYICTKGEFILDDGKVSTGVMKGDTILIPAITGEVILHSMAGSELLEVFIKT
jgi:mannose-6-phosphate isomerase